MRAVISNTSGGPETLVLKEVPDPQPGPKQVLLSVKACAINFPDTLIIEDRYQFRPERPFSPGQEVAGIVSAIGPGTTKYEPGDRVIGWLNWGGMAEKVAVDETQCIPMPKGMPFDEASAFILTFGTSYYGLKERGHLVPGETLLILGAAGGVGLAAVELGKAMGARLIAAASSEEKVKIAKEHGADGGIVYPRTLGDKASRKELSEAFKEACGANGANVIYDAVGGQYSELALRAVAWEGRFLVVGFPAGIPSIPLNLPLLKSCQIVGVFWAAWVAREHDAFEKSTGELLEFYKKGSIRPLVSQRFPFEQASDAIQWVAERKAMGKVVVIIGDQ